MKKPIKPASRPRQATKSPVKTNEGGAEIPPEAVKERGGPDLEKARPKDTGRMGA